jgi:hypothetical protein
MKAYEKSDRGARRSSGHVLNDEGRRLLGVVVSAADDPQRSPPEVDAVSAQSGLAALSVGGSEST